MGETVPGAQVLTGAYVRRRNGQPGFRSEICDRSRISFARARNTRQNLNRRTQLTSCSKARCRCHVETRPPSHRVEHSVLAGAAAPAVAGVTPVRVRGHERQPAGVSVRDFRAGRRPDRQRHGRASTTRWAPRSMRAIGPIGGIDRGIAFGHSPSNQHQATSPPFPRRWLHP